MTSKERQARYRSSPKGIANRVAYRKRTLAKSKAYHAQYRHNPENLKRIRAQRQRFYKTLPYRYQFYRQLATRRGLSFNLSIEQFATFWQKPCRYCGAAIPTIGLDRLDSSKGYDLENIAACCTTCNIGKRTMSPAEYLSHCRTVVAHATTPHP